jgi:hypothetical protein
MGKMKELYIQLMQELEAPPVMQEKKPTKKKKNQ